MYLGLAELLDEYKIPLDENGNPDYSKIKVQEELIIASKQEDTRNEMVSLLSNAVMKKYNCSEDDVYKYWDSYKKYLKL